MCFSRRGCEKETWLRTFFASTRLGTNKCEHSCCRIFLFFLFVAEKKQVFFLNRSFCANVFNVRSFTRLCRKSLSCFSEWDFFYDTCSVVTTGHDEFILIIVSNNFSVSSYSRVFQFQPSNEVNHKLCEAAFGDGNVVQFILN